jgi:hypothetical protein
MGGKAPSQGARARPADAIRARLNSEPMFVHASAWQRAGGIYPNGAYVPIPSVGRGGAPTGLQISPSAKTYTPEVMPIPPFTPAGVLPTGRYACTAAEIDARFVQGYATSTTRMPLFNGWRRLDATARAILPPVEQWIDGGFVEDKNDPQDIDLCVLLDGETFDRLPAPARSALSLLFLNNAKALFGCDPYVIFTYPTGHPSHDSYLRARGYWDLWWGHTRSVGPKGYLAVP